MRCKRAERRPVGQIDEKRGWAKESPFEVLSECDEVGDFVSFHVPDDFAEPAHTDPVERGADFRKRLFICVTDDAEAVHFEPLFYE